MSEEYENTPIIDDPGPTVPVGISAEERQGLIAEAQEARRNSQRLAEELHELRQVTLRSIPQRPADDPVEAALGMLRQGNDPALVDALKGILVPVLNELNMQRVSNQQLQQGLEQIASMQREVRVNQQLQSAIPDIDRIGPKLLEELSQYDAETQQLYVKNPKLLKPLADQVRKQMGNAGASDRSRVERAKTGMDIGMADPAQLSKAESLRKMSDKDFEAEYTKFMSS